MDLVSIQQQLEASLEDLRISNEEKQQFIILVKSLKKDKLAYFRNQSFELVREVISTNPTLSMKSLNVLQQLWKITDTYRPDLIDKHSEPQACFSPGHDCRNRIVGLLKKAVKCVDICVFTISDNIISDAILEAHNRGVVVRIISDNHKSEDLGSDVDWLIKHGLSVRMDASVNHMHHKFAIIDDRWLINGSFNWTKSATDRNQENIVVQENKSLVDDFSQEFERLWGQYS